jgi:hypothetical protein
MVRRLFDLLSPGLLLKTARPPAPLCEASHAL